MTRSAITVALTMLAVMTMARAAEAASCRDELGAARSASLVEQCLAVSPATRPPCNAANDCAMIRDEVKRGCVMLDRARPGFCDGYLAGMSYVEPGKATVAPSFDCAKAGSAAEKAICASDDLAGLDRKLAEAYGARQRAGGDLTALRDAQRAFLRDRDRCPASEPGRTPEEMRRIATRCLADLMRARTEELTGRLAGWEDFKTESSDGAVCAARFGHDGSDSVELGHRRGSTAPTLRFVEFVFRELPLLRAGDTVAFDVDGRALAARVVPAPTPDDEPMIEAEPSAALPTTLAGGQLLRVMRNGKVVFRAPLGTLGAADEKARGACGLAG